MFPRVKRTEQSRTRETDLMAPISDSFCPSCGFTLQSHVAAAKGSFSGFSCNTDLVRYVQPPVVDVARLFRRGFPTDAAPPRIPPTDKDLVTLADPTLTIAVRALVSILKLPSFEMKDEMMEAGAHRLRTTSKEEVERQLAPYAILSLVTGAFLRHLVSRALLTAPGHA